MKLLMSFIDETPSFCLGFECGQLWSHLAKNPDLDNYIFHTKNREQVKLICEHFGSRWETEEIDDTWSELRLNRVAILNMN